MFVTRRRLAFFKKIVPIQFSNFHPVTFDGEKMAECLLPYPKDFGTLRFKLRQTFMDPMRKVHPFMVLCYARGESHEYLQYFGFDPRSETSRLLFTILHVWFIHRAFHKHNLDTRKLLIWEYLWSRMKDILVYQEIEEHNFEYNLVEMQGKTLAFCIALDESFDIYYEKNDHTMLKKMIALHFYKNDQSLLNSEPVERLAFYTIMMESFAKKVPKEQLQHALFVWPEFNFKTPSPSSKSFHFSNPIPT